MTASSTTAKPDEDLAAARDRMQVLGVPHLPVVDAGVIVGVVAEHDIALAERLRSGLRVRDAMRPDPYVVPPTATLDGVLNDMMERGCALAVVADGGTPLGILSQRDVMRLLALLTSEWREDAPCCDRWGHVIEQHVERPTPPRRDTSHARRA